MNFLIDFFYWVFPTFPIHKVDVFFGVMAFLLWYSFSALSGFGIKQMLCIVFYTIMLNMVAILLGFTPSFWWAWGWTFAFIPVFNWWKPMLLIFTTIIAISVLMTYSDRYGEVTDKYLLEGFGVPQGCMDWPCTKFDTQNPSYTGRRYAREQEAAKAKAAASKPASPAPTPQKEAAPAAAPSHTLPGFMYQPVQ